MQKLTFFFILLIIISCGNTCIAQSTGSSISKAVTPTTPESVGAILKYLASDELKGRDTGSEGIEMAGQYIEGYFESAGIAPFYSSYRDTLSNYEETATNIVGVIEGKDQDLKDEWVIIGAHFDHVGTVKPVNGDSIANGANDNASGTTAVMEIARQIAERGNNRRSVMFVLFSAEEKGLKGSKHLAARLKKEGVQVYTMLNFEMIGVPMNRDYLAYLTGYEKSNMAEKLNSYAGEELIGFLPEAGKMQLFKRSDNYPFFTAFNIPSQTVCTFDFTNFDHYHQPGDEFKLMDPDHMALFINKMLPMVEGMVNSDANEIKML
ncbi:M20/M25/M40 family metallo-hydrolase [Robertkochia marina]|uniref:M20/M25/M40 family metallo-hydrolase n=1 Tax=Robertkochia marina TaxID=1227945 RepID=A0A4S3M3X4_9FLAO|nr:M20/M25/M40 family metallo-hydrolase [Robertkochia marina]THD69884.1 M20/M25/M40 family metallo-hydrolase [Robertkochia marina]TRZ46769.1 M20/M25/M40 family metallo-hydrolase [Robertkochia marina]